MPEVLLSPGWPADQDHHGNEWVHPLPTGHHAISKGMKEAKKQIADDKKKKKEEKTKSKPGEKAAKSKPGEKATKKSKDGEKATKKSKTAKKSKPGEKDDDEDDVGDLILEEPTCRMCLPHFMILSQNVAKHRLSPSM